MTDTEHGPEIFNFDDLAPDVPAPEEAPEPPAVGPLPATRTLARYTLDAALTPALRRRIAGAAPLAVVVEAPGPSWVEPLRLALAALGHWAYLSAPGGSDPVRAKPDTANAMVAGILARGGRVAGVSHLPGRMLPSALTAAADVRLVVRPPGPAVLRRVIRRATGAAPRRMPANLGAGLTDHDDLCGAIRLGSSPQSCVARLQAAARARSLVDPSLAEAPPLDQLHGYGAAMDWCQNLVRDLAAWRRGEIEFSAIDRCAVFASAPGLGKTSLVRSLARSAGLPLFATSVPAWFSSGSGYLDSVIRQIDGIFLAAAAAAPALVFLDEVEAIPDRRRLSDRDMPWWQTMVAHLLTTLDSNTSASTARLVIIGATNHPDRLDPAITRPGRLSPIITIGPPDAPALAGILRQHLAGDLAGVDLLPIAQAGLGATGAQTVAWVRGARARARTAGRAMVADDLWAEVVPPDHRSPEALRRCAVHESAHACLSDLLGAGAVHSITILDHEGGAHTLTRAAADPGLSRADIERLVTVSLAGRAAEEEICGVATTGASGSERSDLAIATSLLAGVHASLGLGDTLAYRAAPEHARALMNSDPDLRRQVEDDLARLYAQARSLVREHRGFIAAVADVLIAEKRMTGDEFARLSTAYFRARKAVRGRRSGGRHG